jgi:hypothetical protein
MGTKFNAMLYRTITGARSETAHFIAPVGEALRHCAKGEVAEYDGAPSLVMEPLD